jgi:PTS system mannose-specific IIA component
VLTDVFGATPSNIAQRLVEGRQARLVTGVNLPMLLRCVCYRGEALDALVQRAIVGRDTRGDAGGRYRAPEPEPQTA